MAHSFRPQAPARVSPVGFGPGQGAGIGGNAVGPTDASSPAGATTPAQTPPASSSGSSPSSGLAGAWAGFLGNATSSAQVLLGVGLLGLGLALVVSSTQAGRIVGAGVSGGARRALRFVPGVGALA